MYDCTERDGWHRHNKRAPEPRYSSECSSGVLQKKKSTECADKMITGNSGNRGVSRREERNTVEMLRKFASWGKRIKSTGLPVGAVLRISILTMTRLAEKRQPRQCCSPGFDQRVEFRLDKGRPSLADGLPRPCHDIIPVACITKESGGIKTVETLSTYQGLSPCAHNRLH